MKQITALLLFITGIFFANAQTRAGNSITGTVINVDTKAALEYATVTLFKKGEKKPLTGTTTDNSGGFTLTDIPAGTFTLVIENIGYKAYTINDFSINKKEAIIDLKNIPLTPVKNTLETVTVSSKAKLVDNKIDKIVFNAEKDISSQGGVAADILKKVPQVSVDADGNVQLAGNSGIRFLINGKPSSAFGSNIADVLQSIPASLVKRIEVITNPGAKYDAQGMGGIINIILKSNNQKGYNGNISLTAGTRVENGSLNLNVRNNNFGMNAFVSGNKRLPANSVTNNYRSTTDSNIISTLSQESRGRFNRQAYQAGIGFDWTYKKYNSFSGNATYYYFGSVRDESMGQALQPDKGSGLPDILSVTQSGNRYIYHSVDASLNYKRTFAKEDQELEASISFNPGKNHGRSFTQQFSVPQDSFYYGTNAYNPAASRETIIAIDYTQPFKNDIKWGIGTRAAFYHIESNADVNSFRPALIMYLPDSFLSSKLSYNQKVYAAYTELSFPVGKLFDAKIGGRYERTEINADFSNAVQQVKVPGYNTFVPSIFLSRKIGEVQTIKFSFSKRINRPDYEDLNPFVNTTDPKNLTTGNPYLKPETGHRYELGYNRDLGKSGSMMVNLFYRINDNDVQPYIVYYPAYYVGDSIYTNVSVNTQQNIGRENNTGMNFFADLHLTAKLSVRGNIFTFYRHTINAIDKGLNSNSFNYRFNINTTYQFTNSLVAEFFGNFNAARNEAQGKYPAFVSYTLAMRRQFWQKKASIALTVNNLFSENFTQRTILSGTNFTQSSERIIPLRSIGINFTWKFGKLEFKKDREESDGNLNGPMQ